MSQPPVASPLHVLQRRSDNARFAEVEADLMPAFTALKLDMARTSFVGRKGDLMLFLTDVELGQRKRESALMMANRRDPTVRKAYILFSQLWLLIDPDIRNPITGHIDREATAHNVREQTRTLDNLTERLFGFVTRDDTYRVIDAVFDFYTDIQHAKPPHWMTQAQWLHALAEDDMTVFENGVAVNR